MRLSKRIKKTEDEEVTYWLSYSDMMAALLLVFVLIITFTMLQAKKQYEQKEKELLEQQMLLQEKEIVLKEQEKILQEQKEVMDSQQEQLDAIVGVRYDLVEALRDEFEDSSLSVSVDPQTGAITFDSNVLFDSGQSNLKKGGKKFLEEFLPRYFAVLMDPRFKDYISEIIIEGHTDTDGGYTYNLQLSQARALTVADFCIGEKASFVKGEELDELRGILTANGRSYSDLIYNEDGSVNMAASRRVEFKFRLKDDEMIDQMIGVLNK